MIRMIFTSNSFHNLQVTQTTKAYQLKHQFLPATNSTKSVLSSCSFQIQRALNSISNCSLEHRLGLLLAISHAYYRKIRQYGDTNLNANFKVVVLLLCNYLTNDQHPLLISAACKGLALIGSVTRLPIPDGSDSDTGTIQRLVNVQKNDNANSNVDAMQVDDNEQDLVTKTHVLNILLRLLKSAHSRPRVREESAECLGHLSINQLMRWNQMRLSNANSTLTVIRSGECILNLI